MNNKKTRIIAVSVGIIILMGLSLGTIGYMYTKAAALDNVFADNVYIEDLAVGGLTKEEAKAKLEQDITDEVSKQKIVFTKGEISKEVPLSDLGITYNINEIVDQAFKVGHDKGLFEKYQIAKNGVSKEQHFELTKNMDDSLVEKAVAGCADAFYTAPVNATLKRENRQFITTKEVNGESMDQAATTEKALQALNDFDCFHQDENSTGKIEVEVVTQIVAPECTEASLKDCQTLVSSFSTSYNNASPNRNANLAVASQKITTMVLAGDTFKLSDYLEPFTEEAGYKNAGVIVNGKVEDGIGGGVCQVASTLYNAVLLTDLEVVMRQNHSLAVSYVPLGRDATYSTDAIDFRFKNNSGYPIFIEGYCENNQVIINIYGHKDLKSPYEIKFASQLIETIPAPATVYEDDPTLEEGKEIVETRALDGKRVKLYKLYYQDGVEINRVLVNTSYYKPRAAVVKRGTKKAPVQETPSPSPQEQAVSAAQKPQTDADQQQPAASSPSQPETSRSQDVQNNETAVQPSPSTSPLPSDDDSGFAIVQQ